MSRSSTDPCSARQRFWPALSAMLIAACLLPAAALGWSISTIEAGVEPLQASAEHLVVSEVMTGGASASDEFIEIYNPTGAELPLEGLELVYVTASGATVTRKASWNAGATGVPAGEHVLAANELGAFAAIADATYAGGISATGGSVALRIAGAGSAIDAVGWGTASAWLEGSAAPAPVAGGSLERLPGGIAGSGQDTDDNATDFVERSSPDPQSSTAPPIATTPAPSPSTTPGSTQSPTPSPAATSTPTPMATPSPTLAATPTPAPVILSIAEARALPDGATVTVEGVALTASDFTDGGGYLADASAGIAVLLSDGAYARGAWLRVTGVLDERYRQRTIRASSAGLELLGEGTEPVPLTALTGTVGEALEGQLARISGEVVSSANALSNGVAYDVDDGSGIARVVVYTATGIDTAPFARGARLEIVGVVGQRDSSGTGTSGYRLQPREQADVAVASGSPSPSASGSESPAPSPTPSSSGQPAGTISIAAARAAPTNARVAVHGIVTLPSAMFGDGTAVIQDATGAIVIRLGDEAGRLDTGEEVIVEGMRSAKSGMETIRVTTPPLHLGYAAPPQPLEAATGSLGEPQEALLVAVVGSVTSAPRRTSAENVYFDVDDGSGALRVFIAQSSGVDATVVQVGAQLRVVGVLGQETTGQQPLRGYRLWLRQQSDLEVVTSADAPVGGVPSAPDGGGAPTASSRGARPSAAAASPQPDLPLVPPRLDVGQPPSSIAASPAHATPAPALASGRQSAPPVAPMLVAVTLLGICGTLAAAQPGLATRSAAAIRRLRPQPHRDGTAAVEADEVPPALVPLRVLPDDEVLIHASDERGSRRILPPT